MGVEHTPGAQIEERNDAALDQDLRDTCGSTEEVGSHDAQKEVYGECTLASPALHQPCGAEVARDLHLGDNECVLKGRHKRIGGAQ